MHTWKPYVDKDGDTLYILGEQDVTELVNLPVERSMGGVLAIFDDGNAIHFALFEWQCGTEGEMFGISESYRMVFNGRGYGGALRECRHTYWGEPDNQGYIFYMNFDLISGAMNTLKKWFDGT